MDLTKKVISMCGVLMSAAMVSADDILTADDFYGKVTAGDEVWGIVFGIEAGNELATLKTLQQKASWLSVGWMNVADFDSRLIADVHGITSYPAIRIFNGRVEKPEFPSAAIFDAAVTRPVITPKNGEVSIKEAIEKWLPSRLQLLDGRLASVLPLDDDNDVVCKVSLQEGDVLKIATARAVAMKFWNKISMSLVHSDSEGIQCVSDGNEVDVPFENFTFDELVKALTDANISQDIDEEAALSLRREAALKESANIQSIMQLRHRAVFEEVMASQGIEILFVLNSDSPDFDSHMTSADEIQNAKTKTGQQARFRYLWLDIKTEGKKMLQEMGLRPSLLPAILFYLPVKTQEGQIAKAQLLYEGPFAASNVAKFIDNEMMKGQGLAPVNVGAFSKLSGDSEDKEAAVTQADDEEDPLELEDDSTKGSKKSKKKETKPKKGGKKKERKLSKKEQEKEDKIKEEVAAKKAAREKRVREKKEREEAEKEKKRQEKEDKKKKGGAKKKSAPKSDSDSKKKTKKDTKKQPKTEAKKEVEKRRCEKEVRRRRRSD
eukprot:TRINITY_DN19752_c0_g2_i4.p1 TRINITY_DN19752_c0_g2~~TRINITY_DN19752_c0_g2_i4.p1  ORF type:complete len:566 (+),score=163.93 TRINITY_DN19752_c0_g2_i4:57-1700(+)